MRMFSSSPKESTIREVNHEVERDCTWGELLGAVMTCGLATTDPNFGSGEVIEHRVTLEDEDGCRGHGSGSTYASARENAHAALARAHAEDD